MILEVVPNKELQQIIEEKIMDSQIFSVQWLENNKLVICGINGILKIISVTEEGIFKKIQSNFLSFSSILISI